MFSIVIPTWNNLEYLKLCVNSIKKNSAHQHQIIVHVNDGSDGTLDYIKEEQIEYTYSADNIGICYAVNQAAALAQHDYIVYMNDDMYVCPLWDKYIIEEIQKLPDDDFMFSGTLIEPRDTGNLCVINANFGNNISNFNEKQLLENYRSFSKSDWQGSAWPPTIVSKTKWNMVGGYSIEFSPGMSSDDDFAMKMWQSGCRIFKGISKSRIYHFQAKSTGKIKKNDGRKQFLLKWGINQSGFNKHFIHRGKKYMGILHEPNNSILLKERFRAKLKIIFSR
ncbi:MAG: glycosyltransferase family 2 protein [Bacteroidia bacterium]|nr:glycosyltransferase family 2 protein [Bacteroidia bacterium]MCZ2247692.1 glycosyltransferase [Bacteroidia bacterium]